MTTTTYFYQSGIATNTKVDFNNPAHKELYDLVLNGLTPSTKANELMRLAGLSSSISYKNNIVWSSDLSICERSNDTGLITKWLS